MLKKIPMLSDLRSGELDALTMVTQLESYRPAATICREGEPGSSCFFIVSGEVDVSKRVDGAGDRTITTLRPGAMFGHISLVDSGPRSATCTAKNPVTCVVLDRPDFDTLFSSGSQFAFRFQEVIARAAAEQLRKANERLSLLLSSTATRSRTSENKSIRELQDMLVKIDTGVDLPRLGSWRGDETRSEEAVGSQKATATAPLQSAANIRGKRITNVPTEAQPVAPNRSFGRR
jgi:CRP-like cAMP-binding protein